MRPAALALPALALLLLPLPAAAQPVPMNCAIVRECEGETCTDGRRTTLHFEPTATGLVAWDQAVPSERIALTAIPGEGPPAWSGRAPELDAVVLMTVTGPDRIALSMHGQSETPVFYAFGECGAAGGPPPLTKRG